MFVSLFTSAVLLSNDLSFNFQTYQYFYINFSISLRKELFLMTKASDIVNSIVFTVYLLFLQFKAGRYKHQNQKKIKRKICCDLKTLKSLTNLEKFLIILSIVLVVALIIISSTSNNAASTGKFYA